MATDNQQETLENYYYTGFCAGEMYCGLVKLSDKKCKSGFYITPDLTVSNSDRSMLQGMNKILCSGAGIISPIKGGYNLKIRGWRKVKIAIAFFRKFPPLSGSILDYKIQLIWKAFREIEGKEETDKTNFQLLKILEQFKALKAVNFIGEEGGGSRSLPAGEILGYYFAGLFDAEGSVGLKKHLEYYQVYFALGMRDRYFVATFKNFLGVGYVYYRPRQNIYHYESAKTKNVQKFLKLFSEIFPLKLTKNIERFKKLQRILNDHTRGTKFLPIYYDGKLW